MIICGLFKPLDWTSNADVHNKRRRGCTLLFVTHVVSAFTQNIVYLSIQLNLYPYEANRGCAQAP